MRSTIHRPGLLGALLPAALALVLLASGQLRSQEHAPEKPAGADHAAAAPAGGAPATEAAQGAGGHGGGHEAPEKTAVTYLSQTAWAILSFVVVLLVLFTKLFPAITQAMDKRAADIRDALAAAEKARAEAQEMMARHESNLEKARKEAAAIIEEGKADAVKLKDTILAGAKKDAEDMVSRARREIEQAKTTAIDDLTRRSVQLSLELSSRLIRKNLSADEQQGLIQETIRGLPAA